jgi:hypothetical protein
VENWAMTSKDEEVLSVVEQHPATQAVFERYDAQAGECICCNALFQTIEEVAAKYSLDLEVFLEDINRAASG